MVFVGGLPVGHPLDQIEKGQAPGSDPHLLEGGRVSSIPAPSPVAGLNYTLSYEALTTAPVLRVLLALLNSTDAPISTSVDYATNFFSDSEVVRATSSGDLAVTSADRWIVTDDNSPDAGGPANTTVLYGPGSPPVTPTTVSPTVFECNGTEGVLGSYRVTVPARNMRVLVFFQRVAATTTTATTAASEFDTTSTESPLFAGLAVADNLVPPHTVLNWNLTTPSVVHPRSLPGTVTASTGWSLRNSLTTGDPTVTFTYGTRPPALVPLSGDWDGDGSKTPGIFQAGAFKLSNSNTANPTPAITFAFGDPRAFPLSGDFDGNGTDDVALLRAGTWQVRYLGPGAPPDTSFTFGSGTWPSVVPVSGDWDGDGTDGIGYYCRDSVTCPAGTWNLRHTASDGPADAGTFVYNPGDSPYPVVGDWDANGTDTVGVRSGNTWLLKSTNTAANTPDVPPFDFGGANDLPVVWAQF